VGPEDEFDDVALTLPLSYFRVADDSIWLGEISYYKGNVGPAANSYVTQGACYIHHWFFFA
jgi:hypothetical protein